jgi:putative transcriptional regulator
MAIIKSIRSRLGLTQRALADAINVSQQAISTYEQGRELPPKVSARLIAYAESKRLRVRFDDIYNVTDREMT